VGGLSGDVSEIYETDWIGFVGGYLFLYVELRKMNLGGGCSILGLWRIRAAEFETK
jgi:hypothetical protein